MSPRQVAFEKEISDVPPSFVTIYNRAAAAEAHDLVDAAGPGYREAPEFLLKDFLISEQPAEAVKIRTPLVAALVGSYGEDTNVKPCAERAAWLRNDETHYERRWEGKDFQDPERLIS